ncbi:Hypothetical protein, conserved [Brucella abortus str. 2308 A]|uniref:Uncharacterized protein n=2 Tax=Brucella TaxID=234 RepID=A9M894_BRUC2|nr:Hypothetical protein, conserved [Brucella canis ATCC 23365]ABY40265.1 Hypothetical protein, conserved [Brucella suis ATCC 23445]ADZ66928.1 conserved hypothetical protein [Brucella melitensis M28]AEW14406.1 Fumarase [Brucella canis HSK A52141]AEW16996.1 Fumarase [Brucella abortus A13334]AIB19981.1 Hypothetical protein BSSP3_II1305 [Brucella suis bv. 2]EEP62810.1 Hypothetical protein, conserved [Brucella abortus str. 2308 A]
MTKAGSFARLFLALSILAPFVFAAIVDAKQEVIDGIKDYLECEEP